MNALIKSATIVDTKSDFHNKTVDILIENGLIKNMDYHIENTNNFQEITYPNLHVSQGWFDSSVSFGEPGYEERETIANGLKTAALSGFTQVALNPNTYPVTDTASAIAFIKDRAKDNAVSLLPIGALTKLSAGKDMAELFDMKNAGAVAFGDYKNPISNPNILKIALQYAQGFNALVHSFPFNKDVSGQGVMNENITSTSIGLKGIPNLAEDLQLARDLFVLEYTGGKLHIPTISTATSVALIREAKKKNLDVSCSVAIHNLCLTDEVLKDFNTHYKVMPPLRTQSDVDALLEGLKDGTIDMVTSDHNPIDVEHKKVEFDHAKYGAIGLESAFGALNTVFSTKKTIDLLTKGKQRFGAETHPVAIGEKANITLFNPNGKITFTKDHIISTSKNAIFEGHTLKGHAYGVISNNQLVLKSQP
ncbi:dihydroorotase [Mangrovimonas yunxiaonensis]|uniref:Dihydroorotase n=1 Tax=Mangrovimonas yunxiaonensis TaxID=1197477 RepID=A0A084THX2_9FLAO|nr:dihydroorotase [Mangrovimonas yunxiaonensis]KFB00308.1 dihydroorotase [Mangrovimonas yunxiaonensis]GGH41623.1 dihydroorotase [Mangrovimonas yunxiaonensis]